MWHEIPLANLQGTLLKIVTRNPRMLCNTKYTALRYTARCSVCTAKAVYYDIADILPFSCSVPVVYTAESEKCICSIYCTSTALRSGNLSLLCQWSRV